MFKKLLPQVWAFDVEWVPDPEAGRVLHQLSPETPDHEVMQTMWHAGGANKDEPMPFLKTVLCRVVSIAAVCRTHNDDGSVKLHLTSLPHHPDDPKECAEAEIISKFLNAIGDKKPQLVGFNSQRSDLKILIQRAVAKGVRAPKFARRPEKPWEGVDYFDSKNSQYHVDLLEILGGYGKSTPSLHEMANVSGIPGKLGFDGHEVAPSWLEGRLGEIVNYNECDALTTYLIWLRLAHFGGFYTASEYDEEQEMVRNLLRTEGEAPGREHLCEFLDEWDRLSGGLSG